MSTENMNGTPNGQNGTPNGQNGTPNGQNDTPNGQYGLNGHNGDEKNGSASDCGIAPGLRGEYVDPHLKAHREYESDYSKLALQGGHKGLLSMECNTAKIATLDEFGRRQKSCDNISDYNKIALQGGHRDLLKIEENVSTPSKPREKPAHQAGRTCGDWYGDNKNDVADNNNTSPKKTPKKPTSPEPRTTPTPIRDQRRSNGNCIVPGGEEEPPRFGKKRFNNVNQRQEAPFATGY